MKQRKGAGSMVFKCSRYVVKPILLLALICRLWDLGPLIIREVTPTLTDPAGNESYPDFHQRRLKHQHLKTASNPDTDNCKNKFLNLIKYIAHTTQRWHNSMDAHEQPVAILNARICTYHDCNVTTLERCWGTKCSACNCKVCGLALE